MFGPVLQTKILSDGRGKKLRDDVKNADVCLLSGLNIYCRCLCQPANRETLPAAHNTNGFNTFHSVSERCGDDPG